MPRPQPHSRATEALPSHTDRPNSSSVALLPQHQPSPPGAPSAAARAPPPHPGGQEGSWAPAGALRSPHRDGGGHEAQLPLPGAALELPLTLRSSVPASASAAGPDLRREATTPPSWRQPPRHPPPRLKMVPGGPAAGVRQGSRASPRPNPRRATTARRAAPALRWRTIR